MVVRLAAPPLIDTVPVLAAPNDAAVNVASCRYVGPSVETVLADRETLPIAPAFETEALVVV